MVNELFDNLFNSFGADQAVDRVGTEEKFSRQAIELFITLFENIVPDLRQMN